MPEIRYLQTLEPIHQLIESNKSFMISCETHDSHARPAVGPIAFTTPVNLIRSYAKAYEEAPAGSTRSGIYLLGRSIIQTATRTYTSSARRVSLPMLAPRATIR